MRAALALILVCIALAGCARQIVATPEQAETQNDLDWTIGSTPRPADAEEEKRK